MFSTAKELAVPGVYVIIFFDEIDALCGSRRGDDAVANRVLTEFLLQMTNLR